MPITVQIEDERGAPLGDAWTNPLANRVLVGDHDGTACLRFIDPNGATIFNQRQLPTLLAELRALGARRREAELAPVLRELTAFVQAAASQPRTFVRFTGS